MNFLTRTPIFYMYMNILGSGCTMDTYLNSTWTCSIEEMMKYKPLISCISSQSHFNSLYYATDCKGERKLVRTQPINVSYCHLILCILRGNIVQNRLVCSLFLKLLNQMSKSHKMTWKYIKWAFIHQNSYKDWIMRLRHHA